ncbi:phagosome assembly factor 1-like isoform X2 [Argiope bruennichi]|uniref:phagosome assembly factor 1-like isoform X2 n=1 Tax=Argiope bruennichi TaxID=94029 RepID=UPI002493E9AC|nr:phagosome assembly factor 1-like isoform X2 [Argiope bruennichi]
MLELEVVPERSLGNEQWELVLGMAFSQVVHILQQQFHTIKNVQVIYSELNPLVMDLIINLSQDGIRLIFDPLTQRLKIIEVYCMNKTKLKYCGNVFCSPEVTPTLEQIDHSFGATHPGEYHSSQQVFVLNFRGLTFAFAIDPKLQPRYAHGVGSLQFGSFPVVSKMSIYSGNSLSETSFCNHCYLENLDVLREGDETIGIKLRIITEDLDSNKLLEFRKQIMTKVIKFGDSAQDVTSALGSPSKVFYKSEDKMKIHSPNSHRYRKWSCSDYFYNYFTLGIDVLFDAKSHRVKKFILHTNYPGHYNFNIYFRCNFNLPIEVKASSEPENITLVDVSDKKQIITAFTKWDEMEELLKKPLERPVVLNRASTHNATNPFGSTCCYGYQDIIFEVMPNKHLASVTLYQKKKIAKNLDV